MMETSHCHYYLRSEPHKRDEKLNTLAHPFRSIQDGLLRIHTKTLFFFLISQPQPEVTSCHAGRDPRFGIYKSTGKAKSSHVFQSSLLSQMLNNVTQTNTKQLTNSETLQMRMQMWMSVKVLCTPYCSTDFSIFIFITEYKLKLGVLV